MALFLAALAQINGDAQCREIALGTTLSICKFVQTNDIKTQLRFAQRFGIGGGTGIGSIIYVLSKISEFLQAPEWLNDAEKIARLITPELVQHDQQLDIMAGAAGCILGLLALYRQTQTQEILNKAILCGDHLLNQKINLEPGISAWKTVVSTPLTGFSHGAAGIVYALLQLYAVTQNQDYLDAVC